MKDTIAIHESKKSEKVVRFENEENFTEDFLKAQSNGSIHGVYINKKGEVVAQDIWGETHKNILK